MINWKNMTADEIVKEQLYGGVLMITDEIQALDMFRSPQPQTVAEIVRYVAQEETQMIIDDHQIYTMPKSAITEIAWVHQRLFTRILNAELAGLIEAGLVESQGAKLCTHANREAPAYLLTDKGEEVIERLFPTAAINQGVGDAEDS